MNSSKMIKQRGIFGVDEFTGCYPCSMHAEAFPSTTPPPPSLPTSSTPNGIPKMPWFAWLIAGYVLAKIL